MTRQYKLCTLCPRMCQTNRENGQYGICGVPQQLKVARAALHYWEEGCISGSRGSGAVFFSGCSLHCVFCQNQAIASGEAGILIEKERLAEIFLELQDQGANNINLVTPTQYIPHIVWAVEHSRRQGLAIPIVYNTSSYEQVDSLKRLEGIADIYLPDFKYWNSDLAARYSHAPNYPDVARAAIAEMVRQQPTPVFARVDGEEEEIMQRGVIVRQLLLPGQLQDAKNIVKYLYETYGNQIYLSLMSQYTPLPHIADYPELNRKVSPSTYDKYVDYAISLGVEQGFIQEGDVAEDSFIPDFNGEGVEK